MKTYTIIGGVNGCGKSSLTGVLRTEMNDLGRIIDVDKLTAEQGGDAVAGGKLALQRMEDCLAAGICFTQETGCTLDLYENELLPCTLENGQQPIFRDFNETRHRPAVMARRAAEAGYCVRLYYVGLDTVEECLTRIRNRVAHGGHNIPEQDVRRRFAGRFEALAAVLPYCNTATFYDNGNGFRAVAEYRNGELLPIGSYIPAWLSELRQYLAGRE